MRAFLFVALLLGACGPMPLDPDGGTESDTDTDAGSGPSLDSGMTFDAGPGDAGLPDAALDAGVTDAGAVDAGADDAGRSSDGGLQDAGPDAGFDAGTPDAGGIDAGAPDAGGFDASCLSLSFDRIADGGAWPAGWTSAGGVSTFAVNAGAGSWSPVLSTQPYSLGRLTHPGCGATNLEVRFDAWLPPSGGLGFYVRSNGGFLAPRASNPGAGYALFVENFRDRAFGLWRERNGVELELRPVLGSTPTATWVRARFQVRQLPLSDGGSSTTTTLLRGRVWTPPAPEPSTWTETTDSSPELQAPVSGTRIAIDAFNDLVAGRDASVPVLIDDLELVRLAP